MIDSVLLVALIAIISPPLTSASDLNGGELWLPMPICKDIFTTFDSGDKLLNASNYSGNSSESDWVFSGNIKANEDRTILSVRDEYLLAEISSTSYIWYGHVSAKLKSSSGANIAASFELFSNSQDEISWEFIDTDLFDVQMNYNYQSESSTDNSVNISADTSIFDDYHSYEIDWTEDLIVWSIDGVVTRILNKSDTYNETTDKFNYPQTPSRVKFSLLTTNAKFNNEETMQDEGDLIDKDSEDIKNDELSYYMILKEANITCYNVPNNTLKTGSKYYAFNSTEVFDQHHIMITDEDELQIPNIATDLKKRAASSTYEHISTDDGSSETETKTTSSALPSSIVGDVSSAMSVLSKVRTESLTTESETSSSVASGKLVVDPSYASQDASSVAFSSSAFSVHTSNAGVGLNTSGLFISFIISVVSLLAL